MTQAILEPPKSPPQPTDELNALLDRIAANPDLAADYDIMTKLTSLLPYSDGEPMDSPWHRAAMNLLIEILTFLWRDRDDFYVGGNMFIYFSLQHVRKSDFKGPDFFYVAGADRHRPRHSWIVWEENGKYPDLIIELLSASTAKVDRTTKKDLYEQTWRTHEYFCYDPEPGKLEGWRLGAHGYEPLTPDERGWIWSEELQLWIGTWVGAYCGLQETWPRFYDRNGQVCLREGEAERLEAAKNRARAEAAEAEVARLKALLAQQTASQGNGT